MHELGAIKGIGLRRAARYGDELLTLIHGEEVADGGGIASAEENTEENGFRTHLEAAERLLRDGRGADAVPELGRAIELGGEEARREVDELLSKTVVR
jgi:ATP-dependent DNA helicase RecQ